MGGEGNQSGVNEDLLTWWREEFVIPGEKAGGGLVQEKLEVSS